MLISHKGHTDTIQVYSVTVMTHVKALQAGQSIQGTSEPITPEVRRIRKPNRDPTYPAYAIGDADSDIEATRVAVVTGQRSGQNQLEE